jgi:hypothetical protein
MKRCGMLGRNRLAAKDAGPHPYPFSPWEKGTCSAPLHSGEGLGVRIDAKEKKNQDIQNVRVGGLLQ